MVADLRRAVKDERVLGAFARVPRERFVAPELRHRAYSDAPLAIGHGQTISQPLMVAIMLDSLRLTGGERVLDIGTGSGYQAALLAELAAEVVSVERIADLAEQAAAVLLDLGYENVSVHLVGDAPGWPEGAPYDGIVVAAAAPRVPEELVAQLASDGRLVVPVGDRGGQELMVVQESAKGLTITSRGPCRFVPLVGPGGFPPDAL